MKREGERVGNCSLELLLGWAVTAGCPWFPESCERNPWEETQDQVASHLEMHKASLQIKSEGVPLEVAREKRRKRMSMGDEEKENKVRKH